MLLAYYVAAVNIEATFNTLQAEAAQREGLPEPDYVPFAGIALADTPQIREEGVILDLTVSKNNNERIVRQKETPINVIVGKRWLARAYEISLCSGTRKRRSPRITGIVAILKLWVMHSGTCNGPSERFIPRRSRPLP